MSVVVRDTGSGDYERPEPGLHQAVCTHVVALGPQSTPWGEKEKVAIVFELKEKKQDGKPFQISKIYTASLNEKANLRKELEVWRGRKFTLEELDGFDLSVLVGVNCMLNLTEETKGDKSYTNITAIVKTAKDAEKISPSGEDYPKWLKNKIRKPDETGTLPQGDFSQEYDSDGLPF